MRIKLRYKIKLLRGSIAFGLIRLAARFNSRAVELFALDYCLENPEKLTNHAWQRVRDVS